MRLDIYLTKHHNIQSRNKAQELIGAKKIKINGSIITKPSFKIEDKEIDLEILEEEFYVSRSAYKLKYFLEDFNEIKFKNKIALDIGSSTGGFTQILLQQNVQSVTCVDVGTNQLHNTIKDDSRILICENTDIRDFKSDMKYDVITCDVSFISIHNILEQIDKLAKKEIVILFKPQFEVGIDVKRDRLGVVQDDKAIKKVTKIFIDTTLKLGWQLYFRQVSKIKGKNGNSEELFYFKKDNIVVNKNNITSIAIGGFDGMHLAHQALFNSLDENGAIIVIETGYANLSPKVHRADYSKYPIFYYPLENIKHLDGVKFISLLKEEYPSLKKIVVGYDFHFGTNRKYSTNNLKELFNGEVKVVNEVSFENIAVHSRVIRSYLGDGNIELANKLLDKEYKIVGTIISGQGLGKKQFVATMNLQCDDFLLPASGIYATKTIVDKIQYNSVSFVGHRVTTDGKFAVETHILDKDIDAICQTIQVKFFKKIRDNKKFEEYDKLKQQILKDIKDVKLFYI